jgi:DNA-binding transcriptional ArsR family regulator
MDELSETLRALADPSRRAQLMRLAQGRATSGQLAEILPMSRPAGSQHLSVLVSADLVRTSPVGRERWHEMNPERLRRAYSWLGKLLEDSGSGQ